VVDAVIDKNGEGCARAKHGLPESWTEALMTLAKAT
jgi:hypothetical protein